MQNVSSALDFVVERPWFDLEADASVSSESDSDGSEAPNCELAATSNQLL